MGCVLTLSMVDVWFDVWSSTNTYGVMVCVLTLSVVDIWFDLWSSTDTYGVMVCVLTSRVVDHWWCNGSCAHLECGRSLVV